MNKKYINNEEIFRIYCKMIASNVLKSDILKLDDVSGVIGRSILENLPLFIEAVTDKLNYDILSLKKKLFAIHRAGNQKEYVALGLLLSKLKEERKQLDALKRRSEFGNGLRTFKKFLLETNREDLIYEFNTWKSKNTNHAKT